jgi:hypothetical protein
MEAIVLILTVGLILMSISQALTVRIFLKYLEVIPQTEPKPKISEDDANQFEEEKYVDLSEVTPEEGIKSLTKK